MQTFLPYPDFVRSLECLDYKRLGKQRVEAAQLLDSMGYPRRDGLRKLDSPIDEFVYEFTGIKTGIKSRGWVNHPARTMWVGYEHALAIYHDVSILIWTARGYNNTMPFRSLVRKAELPPWFGNEEFHASHRSNLLRKLPSHYGQFGWKEPDNLPYIWPGLSK